MVKLPALTRKRGDKMTVSHEQVEDMTASAWFAPSTLVRALANLEECNLNGKAYEAIKYQLYARLHLATEHTVHYHSNFPTDRA